MYGCFYIFGIELIRNQYLMESIYIYVWINLVGKFFLFERRPKLCQNFFASYLTPFETFFNRSHERRDLNLFQFMHGMSDTVGRIDSNQFHSSTQFDCVNAISIFRNDFLIQVVHLEFSPWRFNALRVMKYSLYKFASMIDVMDMFDMSQLHKSTQFSCVNVMSNVWNEFIIQSILHLE